jgi:hypothetical protein
MVTGDRADAAETIGAALDLDAVLADRVPSDKVDAVAMEQRLHPTLMVGDGINDAPALAKANVGIAMGARGASASSEAADVVILVDRLDRVSDAVTIGRRTRMIAVQSIVAGMAMSGLAMAAAAVGWLTPVAGALTQEAIDVAVILNALRALSPGRRTGRGAMPAATARALRAGHERLESALDRLRTIADALDDAEPSAAVALIAEANRIVAEQIVTHEREDESAVYPRLSKFLADAHGLGAMSRAHREIIHQARLLDRIADGLLPTDADRYLIRDAQRVIEAIERLCASTTPRKRTSTSTPLRPDIRGDSRSKFSGDASMRQLKLSRVFTLIEPGPVVLVTTCDGSKNNVMTISWTMVLDFTRLFAITTGAWNHSFAALRRTRECVVAVPTVDLLDRVVGIGTCSGVDTDKFAKFKLTALPGRLVSAL